LLQLEVVIKLSDGGEYQLNLDLCDKIVPSKSSYQILSTKIEIILHKSKPCRWLSLEAIPGSEGTTAWGSVISTATTPTPPLVNKPVSTTTTPSSPATSAPQNTSATKVDIWAYPSSKGKKNWDALSKELLGEEKLEGEEALQKVFQDIYANCNDDQKRAMLKSFIESGGTVLSTNWEEVKKGKVKGSAPQGMEMRDWREDHHL
jgi:suppressor of G2 allele of SKP1